MSLATFDTSTIDGIKDQCLYLAEKLCDPSMRSMLHPDLTRAWARVVAAMVDHLLSRPDDALGRIPQGDLAEAGLAGAPGANEADILHATFILTGGWADLLEWSARYRPEDGADEIELDAQTLCRALDGDPRHPTTGEPCPQLNERTLVCFKATAKLRDLRLAHQVAPTPTP